MERTKYRIATILVVDNGYSITFEQHQGAIDNKSGHKIAKDLQEVKMILNRNFIDLKE